MRWNIKATANKGREVGGKDIQDKDPALCDIRAKNFAKDDKSWLWCLWTATTMLECPKQKRSGILGLRTDRGH